MKKIKIYSLLLFLILLTASCNDWLDRDSKTFVDGKAAYENIDNVNSILAGLYARLPDTGAMYQGTDMFTELDESMSGIGQNDFKSFNYDYWSLYDYVLVRDINTYLQNIKEVTFLGEKKIYYVAEARFLRAYVYFEMVKRMGGVPILEEPLVYEPGMEVDQLQMARNKEYEVYDFIASELDEIADELLLPNFLPYNRASKGAALALKCRAMLYAGSIAKYNSQMADPIALPGQEVGIPGPMADKYYEASLKAAKAIIDSGDYELFNLDSNKDANFYKLFTTTPSAGNKEAIFIKEYKAPVVTHDWTIWNLPRSLSGGGTSGNRVNPSLNLVDAFDRLDGTDGKLQAYVDPNHRDETATSSTRFDSIPDSYVYYDNVSDILKNKDYRLFGSIMTPGSTFKEKTLDIRAGIAYYNGRCFKFYEQGNRLDNPNSLTIDGVLIAAEMTGYDGPSDADYVTRTGFYVKKYMDSDAAADGSSGISFLRFRYGEVLLNAAEAAFELGGSNIPFALDCINQIRERAGITEKLQSLTIEKIRHERRVELAFEGHRYYDVRRWRIADELWDGNSDSHTAMLYGLLPYRVYRPGHPTHEKWIFVRALPAKFQTPRNFVRANYYAAFSSDQLTKNPKLVKNPGH